MATVPWTATELKILAQLYFKVLREERSGNHINKADVLREAEAALPGRTHHTLKDRCYRISEVLDDHGIPWVNGWKPPLLVGQSPNSIGVSRRIWKALEPMLANELPDLYGSTDDRDVLEDRASQIYWYDSLSGPPLGTAIPTLASATSKRFIRSPEVVAYVRCIAAGICELCAHSAPFQDAKKKPYLEVHHVRRLIDGGSDRVSNAVALCPNCHRRCHFSQDASLVASKLYSKVNRLVFE